MNNISLDLKEQTILWSVLNNAQHIGLNSLGNTLKQFESKGEADEISTALVNWMEQTQDEYDVINTLKAKLCGDLK